MLDRFEVIQSLLLQYANRKCLQAESDITQLLNNLDLRRADPIDHLEIVMAQVRSSCAEQFQSDILKILDIVSNLK